MTDVELIKKRKNELGWTNKELSEKSGVPEGTVNKILSGATRYPRQENIQSLRKALQLINYQDYFENRYHVDESDHIAEHYAYYKVPDKRKTLDDYYALPDEKRVELIDGIFYDMAAPNLIHQEIILEFAIQCKEYIRKEEKDCQVFISPCDVHLDEDAYTMVQPDAFIVCDSKKCEGRIRVNGAPELVMEVISESNPKHDYYVKLQKYQNAGVKEYWIIDPYKKRVLVYDFWKDTIPILYSFTDEIESGFYPGLKIKCAELSQFV